jgi:hypothetical protein
MLRPVILFYSPSPKVSDIENKNFSLLKVLSSHPRYQMELSGLPSMVEPIFSSKVSNLT